MQFRLAGSGWSLHVSLKVFLGLKGLLKFSVYWRKKTLPRTNSACFSSHLSGWLFWMNFQTALKNTEAKIFHQPGALTPADKLVGESARSPLPGNYRMTCLEVTGSSSSFLSSGWRMQKIRISLLFFGGFPQKSCVKMSLFSTGCFSKMSFAGIVVEHAPFKMVLLLEYTIGH